MIDGKPVIDGKLAIDGKLVMNGKPMIDGRPVIDGKLAIEGESVINVNLDCRKIGLIGPVRTTTCLPLRSTRIAEMSPAHAL